ncbi:MAG: ABC transporter substrate-binding protein [Actinomycetales bacterium]|nr:ABC transporter substrate-binding protein [Actinomycetales bacterium]
MSRRLASLAVAFVLLAGCAGTSGAPTTANENPRGPRLADVTLASDPHAIDEPRTALLAESDLDPVADSPTQQLPVTITDMQGTEVTITDASRILALDIYGSLSRIVFELGLGDQLVGRDVSSAYTEAADLPLVTAGGHDLSGEAILELAPTIILTDTSLGPWDVILQMRDAGIPVVVMDPHRDLSAIPELIRATAQALGVPAEGEVLAERTDSAVQAKLSEIAAIAPQDPADKLRMVFLYVRGQSGVYYMFGSGSGSDALVTALGGVDVAAEIGFEGMRPLNDEGLVKAAPDVILMMTKGLDSVGGVDGLLERLPAVANTPAGQARRVVDMSDTEILSFGPHTADVLDALAVALYAEPETT